MYVNKMYMKPKTINFFLTFILLPLLLERSVHSEGIPVSNTLVNEVYTQDITNQNLEEFALTS